MAESPHSALTAATGAIHPAAYVASADPGSVGAHKFWVDTTSGPPYQLKKRNAANTAWEAVGVVSSLTDPTTTRGDLIARGASALARLAVGAANTILGSNGTDPAWTASPTVSGEMTAADFKLTGLTGSTAAARLVGGTASGAPASGAHVVGDTVIDQTGKVWICTTAGTPGTFTAVSGSGGGGGSGSGIGAPTVPDMFQQTQIRGTGNKTTSSTSFAVIDNTNLPAKTIIMSVGDVVRITLACSAASGAGSAEFDFQVVQPTLGTVRTNASAANGAAVLEGNNKTPITIEATFTATEAGSHTFQAIWAVTSGTATVYNSTSSPDDSEILFTVVKIGAQLTLPYVNVQDRKTSGTAGGTFTSGADRTRDLNTEVEDTHAIASLASNQITLPAGTYRIHARVPARAVAQHVALLWNATASSEILRGTAMFDGSTIGTVTHSVIAGRFVLTTSSALEIRHRCNTTSSTNGFGVASSFGTEIYTVVEIWKEA